MHVVKNVFWGLNIHLFWTDFPNIHQHTFHMDIVYVCSHRTGNRLPFNHFFISGLLALFKDDNSLQMLSVFGLINTWITYGLSIIIIMGSRCNIYSIIEPSHQSGATVILLEPWLSVIELSLLRGRAGQNTLKCLHLHTENVTTHKMHINGKCTH